MRTFLYTFTALAVASLSAFTGNFGLGVTDAHACYYAGDPDCGDGGGGDGDSSVTPSFSFELDVKTGIAGYGAATFEGDEGYAYAEKRGDTGFDAWTSVASGDCEVACEDVSFGVDAWASELVQTQAGATSATSGTPALVYNEAATVGNISISVGSDLGGDSN